jgi:hypothetical protein
VANISWKETSKESEANWSVRAAAPSPHRSTCHRSRLESAPWGIATPFGRPVDPEV